MWGGDVIQNVDVIDYGSIVDLKSLIRKLKQCVFAGLFFPSFCE